MGWWTERAGQLQAMSGDRTHVQEYSEEQARQAVVHTREDTILVVSLLDSVMGILTVVRGLLVGILAVLVWIAWELHR